VGWSDENSESKQAHQNQQQLRWILCLIRNQKQRRRTTQGVRYRGKFMKVLSCSFCSMLLKLVGRIFEFGFFSLLLKRTCQPPSTHNEHTTWSVPVRLELIPTVWKMRQKFKSALHRF
jgi:hypothetical protein